MELGYIVGYMGILFGLGVAPAQLVKIIKTGKSADISLVTYVFLCLALFCYLLHAIYIKSPVFITAQAINLVVNGIILIYLFRHRRNNESANDNTS
jgi:uncharacterized protein with PQ loop repeat